MSHTTTPTPASNIALDDAETATEAVVFFQPWTERTGGIVAERDASIVRLDVCATE
jgi:hypothetical protein